MATPSAVAFARTLVERDLIVSDNRLSVTKELLRWCTARTVDAVNNYRRRVRASLISDLFDLDNLSDAQKYDVLNKVILKNTNNGAN